jgi:beta-carotene ketolase (CrtW type)
MSSRPIEGFRQPFKYRGLIAGAVVLFLWAVLVASAWFFYEWKTAPLGLSLGVITILAVGFTGLFITAHEAMHGLVAPGNPRINAWFGRLAMFLFAGFDYDSFVPKHHEHHDHTATSRDPDFHDGARPHFWSWYLTFMLRHISWRPFALYTVAGSAAWIVDGPFLGFVLSWPLPAVLSSLQLFYFGTYLPHREPKDGYNQLRSRSNDYPEWLSLLTCFHFGYHYEHHLMPGVPWWRLPAARRALRQGVD